MSFLAKSQRDEIFEYWNKKNKNRNFSKKLNLKIKNKTNQLKSQVFSGKLIQNSDKRILVFGNYSIVYAAKPKELQIISFWENHQNPEKLKNILGL